MEILLFIIGVVIAIFAAILLIGFSWIILSAILVIAIILFFGLLAFGVLSLSGLTIFSFFAIPEFMSIPDDFVDCIFNQQVAQCVETYTDIPEKDHTKVIEYIVGLKQDLGEPGNTISTNTGVNIDNTTTLMSSKIVRSYENVHSVSEEYVIKKKDDAYYIHSFTFKY